MAEGQVAGHIACYPDGENMEVTYWLGREFWGRGLATQALKRMLHLVVDRPIFARAAADNIGSIRVLQKCGFKIIGTNKDFANGRGEDTEEYFRLDDVGARGFEPPTSWSQTTRSTKLSYAPKCREVLYHG